jgi:predicted nucleic acid-binding protein
MTLSEFQNRIKFHILHIACAIEGKAEYFLTTDDKILKKGKHIKEIKIIDPIEFIKILEET